jgi:galactose oxidase
MTYLSRSRRLLLSASVTSGVAALLTSVSRPLGAVPGKGKGNGKGGGSPPPPAWSPVYPWPDVAIHLHLLPNGKLLSFSDDDHESGVATNADFSKAFVIDVPTGGAPAQTAIYVPNTTTNMFCSGHAFLPDGRLMVLGGHEGRNGFGSEDVNILESSLDGSGQWHYVWNLQANSPMTGGRWYPGALCLADGSIVVVGGEQTEARTPNVLPQVWQTPVGGGWRNLTNAQLAVPLYMRMHLAPNGKVFAPAPQEVSRYLDTAGAGLWSNGPRAHGYRGEACSVMYDNGKVLLIGGGDPPTATAEIIDLNVPVPSWQFTGSMNYPRRQHNATLLPDGTVLVTGGTSSPGFNDATNAVLAAELWNPATGLWTKLESAQVPRLYHSTALLLPDGRVLSAGGGRPPPIGGVNNLNAEIYSPPYLFKGARPTITGVSATTVSYGQQFLVNTPDSSSISKVSWIALSTVSHGDNMNQRINFLGFSASQGGLFVNAPFNRNLTPPGHYILFLLNNLGVPSVGRIIRIG